MKLGVFTTLFSDRTLEDTLKYLSSIGVKTVELGGGGHPGNAHLNLTNFDQKRAEETLALVQKCNMDICAISVHNNPVHPNKEIARAAQTNFEEACKAAQLMNVETIVTFSGCPGENEHSLYPNWVTAAWPPEFPTLLEKQWNNYLIPYWKEAVALANSYGVKKIALEMHPGFCVYNPQTLLRLRAAVGDTIGANFDPSHLYWQGINPPSALKTMKGAIHHFHAKDTYIDKENTAKNGVLDQTDYGKIADRSWTFRTVGFGHGAAEWKDIISTLRLIGYDGALSIEHEDGLMSKEEGLEKAVSFLQTMIMNDPPSAMWWA